MKCLNVMTGFTYFYRVMNILVKIHHFFTEWKLCLALDGNFTFYVAATVFIIVLCFLFVLCKMCF